MTLVNQNMSIHVPVSQNCGRPDKYFYFSSPFSIAIGDNFKYNFCYLFISVTKKILI